MKKKIQRYLTNYLLTISFILIIIIFVNSLIIISKVVLTQVEPLQEHVLKTKSLLKDIKEVEKATTNKTKEKITTKENKKIITYNYKGFNVTSIAFTNVNENKSIITFFFNKKIKKYKDIYYVEIDPENLIKGDIIIFENKKNIDIGEFISIQDNSLIINTIKENNIIKIDKKKFFGKVFYMKKKEIEIKDEKK